jgi:uncharacterized protein
MRTFASADLAAGEQAFIKGDYAAALNEFLPLAKQGNPEAQFRLGVMYEHGYGVPQDCVQAHMWYNLAAAASGGAEFVKNRDLLAEKMTPMQIAEAQRLAREWKPISLRQKRD